MTAVRRWLRTVAWGGAAALGLGGCMAGGSRTALREDLDQFQPVVVQSPAVAPAEVHAAPAEAIAVAASPAGVIQPVEHREPLPSAAPLAPPPFPPLGAADEPTAFSLAPVPTAIAERAVDEPDAVARFATSESVCPINLSTALALVSGQNPEVEFARWRTQEAYARLEQAQVLWLPSIRVGLSYNRHDGNLQNIEGRIVDVSRSALNAGLGAGAVAAGPTTVPGLSAQFHVADAVFQPQIAERTAWARGHAATAALQDRMLDAALAYLELLEAAQEIAIAQQDYDDTAQLSRITDEFARTGQGLQSDADRLQTELALRRNAVIRADERLAVASARLAEVLSLDTQHLLIPCEATVAAIELVPVDCSRQQLLAQGLMHRPELKENRCLVAEACERLKREQYAPLMPSVLLGMSYGGFGGGIGGNVSRFHDRADFDALAFWEVRNLGFGERAARRTVEAQIQQTRFQQVRLMDRIAREIAESLAQVQFRQQQIAVAETAVARAEDSHARNLERIREGQGLPIEALQSIQALATARREYLTSVMDYNEAQFRLQRALGWPVGQAS